MVTFVESSTISLAIQIVVFGLLIGAYTLKTQKKYRQHGMIMLSAVVLHIISILAVMVPSLASFAPAITLSDTISLLTIVHVFAGVVAAMLGIWLVSSWHLKADFQACFKKKRFMDATLGLWVLAILLGIILYLVIIGAIVI